MIASLALALVPLAAFLPLGPAETAEDPPPVECGACGNAGLRPCPDHRFGKIVRDRHALYCSEAAGCETCAGAEWIDCAECDLGEQSGWLKKRMEAGAEAPESLTTFEKLLERPLCMAESKHFQIICEMKPRKVGRAKANRHDLLHIQLARLEAIFDEYVTVFSIDEKEIVGKARILLWSEREDHEKAGKEACGYMWEEPSVYQRGYKTIYSLHTGASAVSDDEDLHANLVHHVVHGLMNAQKPAAWTGQMQNGWADCGVPHWFEEKRCGRNDNFCYRVEPDRGLKSGKWRRAVRKVIAAGEATPLEELSVLTNEQLSLVQHALGFSLVDYLMARDPQKLNHVLKRLRAQTPLRDAVKETYQQKLPELEATWQEWVLETYPKR